MTLLMGIDLGTSSVKVAVFAAESLQVMATAEEEYGVQQPRPGTAEQDPEQWWGAVVLAVRRAMAGRDAGELMGIGVDGQMHGLVCLGANGRPVYPAIIWADARAQDEVEALAAIRERVTAEMPGPPAAGFMASSALWLSRHRPEILEKTQVVLSPKDMVRLRLTGAIGTDPSDAAATWLMDMATGSWAEEVVSFCGLREEQMPVIRWSTAVCGGLLKEAADELGLRAGTPVVNGCADLAAQALGHGVIDPGSVLVTVGTGGQVLSSLDRFRPNRRDSLYVYQHAVPERWYVQGAILTGGLVLRWLRDLLGLAEETDAYAALSELAAGVPAGAAGLIFLPYLAGERTPHMDAQAAGVFLGLRLHHQAGHLARAIMEGVGFALKECLELVAEDAAQVILSGGVTQSTIWPQILADIWAVPVEVAGANMPKANTAERDVPRACLGAGILAGVGTGVYGNAREALVKRDEPALVIHPQNQAVYAERYEQYRRLYPLLRDEMHALQGKMGS